MKKIIIICFLGMLCAYRIIPNNIPKDKIQHLNKEVLTEVWKEAMEAKHAYQQIHNTREELIENLASSAPREEFIVNVDISEDVEAGDPSAKVFLSTTNQLYWNEAGANPITISGLSGLGDTLASSYSPLSRNRSAGELIGKKHSINSLKTKINNVIEGIDTLYGAKQLSDKISHNAQFIDLMIRVCTQQTDPMSLIKNTIGEIE